MDTREAINEEIRNFKLLNENITIRAHNKF